MPPSIRSRYRALTGEIMQLAGCLVVVAALIVSIPHWDLVVPALTGLLAYFIGGFLRRQP